MTDPECPQCGATLSLEGSNCANCDASSSEETVGLAGRIDGSGAAVLTSPQAFLPAPLPLAASGTAKEEYDSIGGWLALPAIGLMLSVLRIGAEMWKLLPLYSRQNWALLTTPGARLYNPWWRTVLGYELVGNSLLLLAVCTALVCFFQRRKITTRLMVTLIPLSFAYSLGDQILAGKIPSVANTEAHANAAAGLWVAFISLHVWIPYFLLSKRVKATFVK